MNGGRTLFVHNRLPRHQRCIMDPNLNFKRNADFSCLDIPNRVRLGKPGRRVLRRKRIAAVSNDRENGTEWRASVAIVEGLGVEDPEGSIAQAFGWSSQKYWQNEKIEETPNPENVQFDPYVYMQTFFPRSNKIWNI